MSWDNAEKTSRVNDEPQTFREAIATARAGNGMVQSSGVI